MDDLISRQNLMMDLTVTAEETKQMKVGDLKKVINVINNQPSAQPEDWMERNKERILQAGMEGREIEFRICGRLFAIREKAQ